MGTIIFYVRSFWNLLITFPELSRIKKLKPSISNEDILLFSNTRAKKWAIIQMKIAGANIHLTGEDNIPKDRPVLFISNHQSNFDIPVLIGFLNKSKGFIAKEEMKKLPLLSDWMLNIGCIYMSRGDIRQSAKAITEGIQTLKNGYSLVIFPEGTRSKSNKIGEFKAGSFKLATKSQVPIVPITINGTYKLYEGNGNKIKPADIYITIHKPVETKDLTKEEQSGLPVQVKKIIESKL